MENQHKKYEENSQLTLQKYYQFFKGKNVFLCNGKYMIGASIRPVIFTLMLINIPCLLKEILVIKLLNGPAFIGTLVPYIVLHILANVFMFRTILTDPGIITRYNEEYTHTDDFPQIPQRRLVLEKRNWDLTLGNHMMKFKECRTCHIFRPPRSIHCDTCDNCVERFDHHCPWLGVCIGKRNYRNFFLFVSCNAALTLLSIFISLYRILHVRKEENAQESVGEFLKKEPYTMISLIYSFLFSLFLVPLFTFHVWLIKNNLTTNEFLRKRWKKLGVNPFKKKNFASNCTVVMCLKSRASFIKITNVVSPVNSKPVSPNTIIDKDHCALETEDRRLDTYKATLETEENEE